MRFTTVDAVHETLGRLFQDLSVDPELGPRIATLETVVQLRLRKPDTVISVVAGPTDGPAVSFGESPTDGPAPGVVLTLDADVAHELWLGRENVTIAVARGLVQARGDVTRLRDLFGFTDEIAARYEQLLRAHGRDDLLADAPAADATTDEAATSEGEPPAEGDAPTDGGDAAATDGDAVASADGAETAGDTDGAATAGDEPTPAADGEDPAPSAGDAGGPADA
ncbi:MAG: hypothetical protein M0P31_11760 [Solirubrobacteraceae bacterium]|nr:hypothetical protein [Solirubrobacteraceae bacterium]